MSTSLETLLNIPPLEITLPEPVPAEKSPVVDEKLNAREEEFEDDFAKARQRLKDLAETATKAVDDVQELAETANDIDAFETLSSLIKTAVDVNKQVLESHRTRKNLHQKPVEKSTPTSKGPGNPTVQNVFVGNSRDLLNMVKEAKKKLENDAAIVTVPVEVT